MRSDPARADLLAGLEAGRDWLVAATARLVAAPSPNPPGDTRAAAEAARALLADIPGIEIRTAIREAPIGNLAARRDAWAGEVAITLAGPHKACESTGANGGGAKWNDSPWGSRPN